jgi:hypothetical protein
MNSIKGGMMVLEDTWKTFQIEIGTTLWKMFGPMVRLTTDILNTLITFSKTPIGKPIIILAGALGIALTVGGALLVAFTTLKLITLASTVSFANMGRTLTWAWTSSAAAALRYATVAKGAMLVNTPTGARWKNIATGRFVSAASLGKTAAAGGAGAATKQGIRGLLSNLFSVSKIFGTIANVMKGFLGGAMMIGTILVALIGFKNIIKIVGYALGSLVHAVMFIVDYIANLGEGPLDAWKIAKDRFKVRNEKLQDLVGIKRMDPMWGNRQKGDDKGIGIIGREFDPNAPLNPGNEKAKQDEKRFFEEKAIREQSAKDREVKKMWELLKTRDSPISTPKLQPISLNMSGQKVGEVVLKEQNEKASQRLNAKVN